MIPSDKDEALQIFIRFCGYKWDKQIKHTGLQTQGTKHYQQDSLPILLIDRTSHVIQVRNKDYQQKRIMFLTY